MQRARSPDGSWRCATAEQDRTHARSFPPRSPSSGRSIERLRKQVEALTERFVAFEHQNASEVPVAKPPHW